MAVSTRALHVEVIRQRAKELNVEIDLRNACIDMNGKTTLCFRGKNIQQMIEVIRGCSPQATVCSHYCDFDGDLEVRVHLPSDSDLWWYSTKKARIHPLVQCTGATALVLLVGGLGGLATLL